MTDNDSVSLTTNGMRFTFPTDYLSPLGDRFEILGIGNNHALDFGEEGLRQTKNNLTREGISFFGDYLNRGDNNSVVVKKNGIKIGFVGYHSLTETGFNNVLLDTEKMRAMCDFVIAMPNWGEEYELEANDSQKEAAKKLIDAGADMVIGGHPHVTQPISVYKGKVIFWSIGNFIFDQYFSEETMRSISPTVELTKQDGVITAKYGIVPISIGKDSRPFAMDPEAAGIFLGNIAERSDVTDAGKADIRSGKINPETADKKDL
jgi:poly-gamma-glutamate synthesis protein (capsule biosynthesis protein)